MMGIDLIIWTIREVPFIDISSLYLKGTLKAMGSAVAIKPIGSIL
jgi:hypothetical protein